MPRISDKTNCQKGGFTLIEMMAVMTIIALISSLVVLFIPGTGRSGLKAVVMNTVALLRRERLGAILARSDRHVSLDNDHRILIGDSGDRVVIPHDVAVNILGVNEVWSGRVAVAAFHANGGSSGAALKFSRDGASYEVHVNWYTGGVSIEGQ